MTYDIYMHAYTTPGPDFLFITLFSRKSKNWPGVLAYLPFGGPRTKDVNPNGKPNGAPILDL